MGVWLALLALAALGMLQLRIDTTIGSFLNRTDRSWRVYQRSLERHGGDEFIAVAVEGKGPFDSDALAAVLALTHEFERIPEIRRVDSLSTVPLIRPDPDGGIRLDAALTPGVTGSASELDAFVGFVRSDRIAPRSLVSKDEHIFAVNLLLNDDVDGDRERVVNEVSRIVEGYSASISGVPVFRAGVSARTRSEIAVFVPLTVLLVALVLAAVFRSAQAIWVALVVGGMGAALCLGVMGFVGTTLSVTTMILPSILLALGCAYSMHMLTAARGVSHSEGMLSAAQVVARPIALSGLTTAIGFLVMATVPIAVIRDLASFGALGVLVVTAAAVTLAPALLTLRPLGQGGTGLDSWIRHALRRRLVAFVATRRRELIAVWVAALALFALGISRLEVSSDIIPWFPRGTEIRDSYEHIRERLSGITPVNVLIESQNGESVTRPHVVRALDALARDLEALPQVGKALSVADPLRQMHSVFLEETDAGLPSDWDQIEHSLLHLESVEQLRDVLTPDRLGANILLRVDNNASSEIVGLGDWVESWWEKHGPAGFTATTTGIMYEFGRAQDDIAYGQLRGLSLAILAIGVLFFGIFRESRLALKALVPNVVPLGIAFGFMGLVGIPLDAATVCLGSLALGIAVDDTIHVMIGFRDGVSRGEKPREALETCFRRVLPALVFTTVTIAVGFGVLWISEFTLIRNLGLVTSGVVVLCLLADVLLLPALLLGERRPRAA
ncbi:MAG: MMPL family transporter [Myxococcota bacterium]